jgi:hypothetical protein
MNALLPSQAVYTRPYLYPKQLTAIFATTRYAEIEASTKSGKTHGCICWIAEQAFLAQPGQHVWWVAPWYPAAEIAYRRMKRALPKELFVANESKLNITLANEVMVWFKSGEKPDALYGEDVVAAVLDEASRMREEAFHAVRSTLTATRGKLRLIGNVKGRKNWFWRICRLAQSGHPDHTYSKLTWRDAVDGGIMDAREADDAKSVLPEAVWKELYEAEAGDDQGNPFGLDAIRSACGPMSLNDPVCYGVDLAKSVDYTWIVGLDSMGAICRSARFQLPWGETIERIAAEVQDKPTLIDSTGVGDPIVETLQKRIAHVEGYKFSSSSKQQLMEGLAFALQRREVSGIPEELANELELFEYHYTRTGVQYTAPEGLHDDGVCALALAVMRWRTCNLFDIAGGGAVEALPTMERNGQQVDPEVLSMLQGSF